MPLCAQNVARVGDYAITQQELEERMDVLYDNSEAPMPYNMLRETALQALIDEYVMMAYAAQSGIVVSSSEVDSYFISLYGSHPKFQTNGRFDRAKFNSLRQTPEIKAILDDLNRELLVDKTRQIIESRFRIGDDDLLDRYIFENFHFDLDYIVIDEDLADVDPELRPQDAYDWWRQRQNQYRTPKRVRLQLLVAPDADFAGLVDINDAALLQAYADLGVIRPFEEVRDSLAALMRQDQLRALGRREAQAQLDSLSRGLGISRGLVDTRPLTWEDNLGQLPQGRRMLQRAFEMRPGNWSELFDLGWGWAAFVVTEAQREGAAPLEEVGAQV